MFGFLSICEDESFPFVLVGNKVDKESQRAISLKTALRWCEARGNIPYFDVSAKDALNIDAPFLTIAKDALARKAQENSAEGAISGCNCFYHDNSHKEMQDANLILLR